MKKLFLVALTMFATSAFAVNLGPESTAISGAYAGANADSYARATAHQAQMLGRQRDAMLRCLHISNRRAPLQNLPTIHRKSFFISSNLCRLG